MAERILTKEQKAGIENDIYHDLQKHQSIPNTKYDEVVVEAWLREQRKITIQEVGKWLEGHRITEHHQDTCQFGWYRFLDDELENIKQGILE